MTIDREIKIARNSRDENRRTIDVLKSIEPTRPEDVSERDRQLRNATTLQKILDQFTVSLEDQARE